jgi:hypothetical protein
MRDARSFFAEGLITLHEWWSLPILC